MQLKINLCSETFTETSLTPYYDLHSAIQIFMEIKPTDLDVHFQVLLARLTLVDKTLRLYF